MITTKIKPGYKKLLLGILFLVLVAGAVVWYIFNKKFADTIEVKPDYTVKVMDLLKEFQQNDSLANSKYIEQIISVKGKVSSIETVDTTVNIKMADTLTGDYVIFSFQQQHQDNASKIQPGDVVSIIGSCSGGVYSEILDSRYISFKRSAILP